MKYDCLSTSIVQTTLVYCARQILWTLQQFKSTIQGIQEIQEEVGQPKYLLCLVYLVWFNSFITTQVELHFARHNKLWHLRAY